jgi:nicotinamide riboside kinase
MKIGFVGAQGTGKTTLAEELMTREYFNDFVFSPSSSRRLSSRLGISQSASPFAQLAITVARVGDEDASSNYGRQSTLSDRTPLDSLAYTKYQLLNVWGTLDAEGEICLEVSERMVRRVMRDYDAIAYFPNYGWPEVDDGVRPQGAEYQADIARYCQEYLALFGIKPYIVANESIDKRADAMVKWLKRSVKK